MIGRSRHVTGHVSYSTLRLVGGRILDLAQYVNHLTANHDHYCF